MFVFLKPLLIHSSEVEDSLALEIPPLTENVSTRLKIQLVYRVGQVVVHLGLVDFDFYIPSSCPAPQPILPNFQLPKQNEAGSGTPKINVNPTQVHDHLPNPVD